MSQNSSVTENLQSVLRMLTADIAHPAKNQTTNVPTPNSTKRSLRAGGMLGIIIGMMRSTKGTTIEALSQATGWQAHSVRGAISGGIKKKLGLSVTSAKADGVRTYCISD